MKNNTYGDNVEGRVEGNKLYLEIDLTKDYGMSSTGKSITVATTRGFQPLGVNGIAVSLNCMKKMA